MADPKAKSRTTKSTEVTETTETTYASADGDTQGNGPMRGDGTKLADHEVAPRQQGQEQIGDPR